MSSSLFRPIAAFASALILAVGAIAAPAPGYVDFGTFTPVAGQQFVEVEVDGALLKLASMFADKKDPEIGKIVANLERIRVNVVGLSDDTRESTTERVRSIRESLGAQGWKRVVTVQEKQGDDVGVYLKQDASDVIQGIVVTVISGSKEAVFVNIVGQVRLEQIAALGERLNIAPLQQLNLAAR
jgi:hypothetical protein